MLRFKILGLLFAVSMISVVFAADEVKTHQFFRNDPPKMPPPKHTHKFKPAADSLLGISGRGGGVEQL